MRAVWIGGIQTGGERIIPELAYAVFGDNGGGSGAPTAPSTQQAANAPTRPFLVISPYAKANFITHFRTAEPRKE
jgi:hypothetical protein